MDGEAVDAWGDGRLALVLAYAFNAPGRDRGVDVAAAARAAGVTVGTIRRWLRKGLPAARREAVAVVVAPSNAVLEQEVKELEYARQALLDLVGRGAPINPSWKKEGWLSPHVVAIVRLEKLGVCVVRIARAEGDAKSRQRLRAGGGVVIEQEVVKNRFAAQIAKGELLDELSEWRIVLPGQYLDRGRTEAWLMDAPRPTLTWLVDHPQVKIRSTRRRLPAAKSNRGKPVIVEKSAAVEADEG